MCKIIWIRMLHTVGYVWPPYPEAAYATSLCPIKWEKKLRAFQCSPRRGVAPRMLEKFLLLFYYIFKPYLDVKVWPYCHELELTLPHYDSWQFNMAIKQWFQVWEWSVLEDFLSNLAWRNCSWGCNGEFTRNVTPRSIRTDKFSLTVEFVISDTNPYNAIAKSSDYISVEREFPEWQAQI